MNLARRRLWTNAFPMEALRTRIECHRASTIAQRQPPSLDDFDVPFDSKLPVATDDSLRGGGARCAYGTLPGPINATTDGAPMICRKDRDEAFPI